jgi:hypothetical protein
MYIFCFSTEQITQISSNLSSKVISCCNCSRLLFWLSSLGTCDRELSVLIPSVVDKLSSLSDSRDLQNLDTFSEINFLLRFLANLAAGEARPMVSGALSERTELLSRLAVAMRREVCWLLANLTISGSASEDNLKVDCS